MTHGCGWINPGVDWHRINIRFLRFIPRQIEKCLQSFFPKYVRIHSVTPLFLGLVWFHTGKHRNKKKHETNTKNKMQHNTLITMANGELRLVEHLDVGDSVLSFNGMNFVPTVVTAIRSKNTDENLMRVVGKWTRNALVCEGTHMLDVGGQHMPIMYLKSDVMATVGPNAKCRYGLWIFDGIHEVLDWNLRKECREKKMEYRNPEPPRRSPFETPTSSSIKVQVEPFHGCTPVSAVETQWGNVVANGFVLYDYEM
jgi:hypothetical protein